MSNFFSSRVITAREPHRCESCRRTIRTKVRYVRIAQVFEDKFYCDTLCRACAALISSLFALGDYEYGIDYRLARSEAKEFVSNCTSKPEGWSILLIEWRKQLKELR